VKGREKEIQERTEDCGAIVAEVGREANKDLRSDATEKKIKALEEGWEVRSGEESQEK
jgi:hypothetical protein